MCVVVVVVVIVVTCITHIISLDTNAVSVLWYCRVQLLPKNVNIVLYGRETWSLTLKE